MQLSRYRKLENEVKQKNSFSKVSILVHVSYKHLRKNLRKHKLKYVKYSYYLSCSYVNLRHLMINYS